MSLFGRAGFGKSFRIKRRDASAVRAEMRDEVEAHLALCVDQLVRRGVPPDVAMLRARARFGDFDRAVTALCESATYREGHVQRREYWDAIRQDVTLSLRQIRRAPALTIAITLTLALGLGANLVVFGVADRLLLSAAPGVRNAGSLALLSLPQGHKRGNSPVSNFASYQDLRAARSFSAIAGYSFPSSMSLGRGERAEMVRVNGATASLFPLLGVTPAAGRFFTEDEDRPPRGSDVAVISY